jgi:hypothetical protein
MPCNTNILGECGASKMLETRNKTNDITYQMKGISWAAKQLLTSEGAQKGLLTVLYI